jgi:superfamily II DNA or RNA helicase
MKISIGGQKDIWDFTLEEKKAIVESLTLNNPAYEQVIRHSPYSYTTVPKYLFYATTSGNDLLNVPRGYKIPFPHYFSEDSRITHENIIYPKLKIEPRKTQQEAIDAYLLARKNNPLDIPGVFEIPTGKGKSILGIMLAAKLKQRALVIVGKDDLVDTWMEDTRLSLGIAPRFVGLVKAKDYRLGHRITLTTIQTLSKLPLERLNEMRDYFSMVIVDEFHHSAAKIYEVINTFPAKDRIGLTATAMRNDNLDEVLHFYFGGTCFKFEESDEDDDIIAPKNVKIIIKNSSISYNPPTQYLWTDGEHKGIVDDIYEHIEEINDNIRYRCNSEIWKGKIDELLSEGKVKQKPMNPHKIYDAIDSDPLFNKVVANDICAEYLQGKSCLAFCKEKEHVRMLAELVEKAGVPATQIQLYYGDAKGKNAKKEMREKAESKEVLVTIATYAIATEGTNVKAWERCFLAMTFNNAISTIQAIGRVRRKKAGKNIVKVFDYRHPRIKGARSHGATRDKVYRERGFSIVGEQQSNSIFTRGWKG